MQTNVASYSWILIHIENIVMESSHWDDVACIIRRDWIINSNMVIQHQHYLHLPWIKPLSVFCSLNDTRAHSRKMSSHKAPWVIQNHFVTATVSICPAEGFLSKTEIAHHSQWHDYVSKVIKKMNLAPADSKYQKMHQFERKNRILWLSGNFFLCSRKAISRIQKRSMLSNVCLFQDWRA